MGTTMDNSSCEWVRGRLPLWMGPGGGLNEPGDDGGDLSVEDRRAMERHLGSCPACRERRSGLSRALEVLAATADSLPAVPDGPSLWPALERRIATQHSRDGSPRPRARESVAGTVPTWALAALDDDRPLRSAWVQDTLKEVAETAGLGALSDRVSGTRRGWSGRSPRTAGGSWRVVGTSLAASILALLVIMPASWRQQVAADAIIRRNAEPVEGLVVPMAQADSSAADIDEFDVDEDRDIAAGQLARAELVKPPADPPASADAKSASSSRFDYDLEHGTPMPPDGRDAKSVY
jgi:hypothetical protein